MQAAPGVQVLIFHHAGGDICKVADLGRVNRADQAFGLGLRGEYGIHQHDVICTGVGAQLGKHLLFGVEVFVHDSVSGGFGEVGNRPIKIGAVALPVQDADFICHGGRADQCRREGR